MSGGPVDLPSSPALALICSTVPALGARIASFSSAVSAIASSARPDAESPSVRLGSGVSCRPRTCATRSAAELFRARRGRTRRFRCRLGSAAGSPRPLPVGPRACRDGALRVGHGVLGLAPIVRPARGSLVVARALAQRDLGLGGGDAGVDFLSTSRTRASPANTLSPGVTSTSPMRPMTGEEILISPDQDSTRPGADRLPALVIRRLDPRRPRRFLRMRSRAGAPPAHRPGRSETRRSPLGLGF